MKWGHLVYLANGPGLLIRAEEARVLFGFWRGQRLRAIEPRLKPGGNINEMATLELSEGMIVKPATVRRLTREAVALGRKIGDPRLAARPGGSEEQWRRGTMRTLVVGAFAVVFVGAIGAATARYGSAASQVAARSPRERAQYSLANGVVELGTLGQGR